MSHELSIPPDPPEKRARRFPLHTRILAGLIVGAVLGIAAHAGGSRPQLHAAVDQLDQDTNGVDDRLDWVALNIADPIGRVFLRLVLMVVLPLIVSALALAVVELGDLRRLGSVGLKTLLLTLLLSGVAVSIGVVLVNALRPGERLSESNRNALAEQYARGAAESVAKSREAKSVKDTLLDIIPENPFQEMVGALDGSSKGNGILAVMFFALVMGAAMAYVGERATALVRVFEGVYAVCMQVIDWAMQLAPLGVACLVFAMTSRLGGGVFVTLIWFLVTVMSGFAIQLCVVYPLLLIFVARQNPRTFFRAIEAAMLTAFGTSSSNATLPVSLRVAEERLGLPPAIARFVLTVGATGNQNGTALFEGVVVLFLAQVFGVDLSLGQQITVVLLAVLAGVGTAGVPGGSIPMIVLVLKSIGVPGESIAIILGIDRICDMCRTVLNVTGDLALATCVAEK
jgi:dicarboxylate/amino acid:cation (Na+ or H+) symporter, DAACS family